MPIMPSFGLDLNLTPPNVGALPGTQIADAASGLSAGASKAGINPFALAGGVTAALGMVGSLASGLMSTKARQAQFDEQIRNLRLKRDYTLSLTNARASASGIMADSASTVAYLRTMKSEFDREISALKDVKKTTFVSDLIGTFSGGLAGGSQAALNFSQVA